MYGRRMDLQFTDRSNRSTVNGIYEKALDSLFWDYLLPALGLIMFYKCVISLCKFLFSAFLVKELDLPRRFGKGSWVVVTGCTEGIGLEFCHAFARRGFNLVMVARNLEKIEKRAAEILSHAKNIQFKAIVADFDKNGADAQFYKDILVQVGDVDVSVLINNVGILDYPSFVDGNSAKVMSMLKVNMYSQTLMQQIFVDRLQKRSKRSAIINMGSSLTIQPNTIAPIYAATKIFCKYLTIGLSGSGEYENIDFLCLRPNATSTAMTKHTEVENELLSDGSAIMEVDEEGTERYALEKILDIRLNPITHEKEFKIKWRGYPYEQSTWEPLENLDSEAARDLILDFEADVKCSRVANPKSLFVQKSGFRYQHRFPVPQFVYDERDGRNMIAHVDKKFYLAHGPTHRYTLRQDGTIHSKRPRSVRKRSKSIPRLGASAVSPKILKTDSARVMRRATKTSVSNPKSGKVNHHPPSIVRRGKENLDSQVQTYRSKKTASSQAKITSPVLRSARRRPVQERTAPEVPGISIARDHSSKREESADSLFEIAKIINTLVNNSSPKSRTHEKSWSSKSREQRLSRDGSRHKSRRSSGRWNRSDKSRRDRSDSPKAARSILLKHHSRWEPNNWAAELKARIRNKADKTDRIVVRSEKQSRMDPHDDNERIVLTKSVVLRKGSVGKTTGNGTPFDKTEGSEMSQKMLRLLSPSSKTEEETKKEQEEKSGAINNMSISPRRSKESRSKQAPSGDNISMKSTSVKRSSTNLNSQEATPHFAQPTVSLEIKQETELRPFSRIERSRGTPKLEAGDANQESGSFEIRGHSALRGSGKTSHRSAKASRGQEDRESQEQIAQTENRMKHLKDRIKQGARKNAVPSAPRSKLELISQIEDELNSGIPAGKLSKKRTDVDMGKRSVVVAVPVPAPRQSWRRSPITQTKNRVPVTPQQPMEINSPHRQPSPIKSREVKVHRRSLSDRKANTTASQTATDILTNEHESKYLSRGEPQEEEFQVNRPRRNREERERPARSSSWEESRRRHKRSAERRHPSKLRRSDSNHKRHSELILKQKQRQSSSRHERAERRTNSRLRTASSQRGSRPSKHSSKRQDSDHKKNSSSRRDERRTREEENPEMLRKRSTKLASRSISKSKSKSNKRKKSSKRRDSSTKSRRRSVSTVNSRSSAGQVKLGPRSLQSGEIYGNPYDHQPKKILDMVDIDGKMYFEVQWERTKGGVKPVSSYVKDYLMADCYPIITMNFIELYLPVQPLKKFRSSSKIGRRSRKEKSHSH